MNNSKKTITSTKVRMYKLGTGDCISVKFLHNDEVTFTMLFDCGCINASKTKLTPFIKELIRDVGGHVVALIVTHEHQDHVLGFQRCEDLFVNGLTINELWMGWTENDNNSKVKRWKKEFGEKKKALARSADLMDKNVNSAQFKEQLKDTADSQALLSFHKIFAGSVKEFAQLHANESAREYKGPLKGMAVVKNKLNYSTAKYMSPGEIHTEIKGLDGVKLYVLGPPKTKKQVDKEKGRAGESYRHNKELDPEEFQLHKMRSELSNSDYFVRTVNQSRISNQHDPLVPFSSDTFASGRNSLRRVYNAPESAWRRIDSEWLESSANLALRMNSLTNNLSLVLAIEFENTGKVMLFPGDAEFGSWESWHNIKWDFPDDLSVEKLLNNTVFYKVAHHLSHNGTAQSQGLEMMTHKELTAMATLNYDVISSGWKSTMPNRAILKELLERTQGRTIIQNTSGLFFDIEKQIPVDDKIDEYQQNMTLEERKKYRNAVTDKRRYVELTLTDL